MHRVELANLEINKVRTSTILLNTRGILSLEAYPSSQGPWTNLIHPFLLLTLDGPFEPTKKAQTKERKGSLPITHSVTGCPRSVSEVNADRRRRRREASKMSGNGVMKKVSDAATKAGKAIDWDGLAKMLVSDEARKEFANLRRTFEDVNHQLQTKFSQVIVQSSDPRIWFIFPRSGLIESGLSWRFVASRCTNFFVEIRAIIYIAYDDMMYPRICARCRPKHVLIGR